MIAKYPEKDGKKECNCCHQVLDVTSFHKAYPKRKDGTYPYNPKCRSCYRKKYKSTINKWRGNNRDMVRESNKRSYSNSKQDGIRYQRLLDNYNKRYHKDLEKSRITTNKRHNKAAKLLTDAYIKAVLSRKSDLTTKDIPQELIELKRTQLQLYRQAKSNQNDL